MSIDYNQLPPPAEGDLPPFWKGTNPGDSVEGTVSDVRIVTSNDFPDAPCIDIATGALNTDGSAVIIPVLASTNSLYRQVHATRPEVGGRIRVTFQGFSGRAKLYQLDYQAPAAGAAPVQQAPVAMPAPAPTGFAQPGDPAAPWGQ